MTISKKQTKINNLTLSGPGFGLSGDMIIDKGGLRSANFPKISLNKNDQLTVRIRRSNADVYTITANGKYLDSRVLINKLFHTTLTDEEQNESNNVNFDLSVNIQKVKGFGGREADNLILHYNVKDGWLETLNLNTHFANSQRATIRAETKDSITSFKINSQNAGTALSFLNLYTHMINGKLVADLKRKRKEPFLGDVIVEDFVVVDEPRLKKLVSNKQLDDIDRDGRLKSEFGKIQTNRVRFPNATAKIEKGEGYLKMDGSLTGIQIGLTYNGTLFDSKNRMNVSGTFMPAFGISRIVSAIPFVGQILSNGKDSGLIGITYNLHGPSASPRIQLNPLSIVAPGIFKKVFEIRAEN
ncbi:MAG: AsmA-like C-terminal region-containing protein [Hyphomicrobiales bacterium]|nr:AsmA-like C-terminal region-containing protein [Hyphomicrobiales bacterium]